MKHLPERTCVACRTVRPKRELVRLVRLGDGEVAVDEGGRESGRGAYLCGVAECWEAGLARGRLEHVLRTGISDINRRSLTEYGKHFRQGAD